MWSFKKKEIFAVLPERFTEKMKSLLGEDFPKFISALENEEAVRGLRVNTLKCGVEDFVKENALPITPLDYSEVGFILDSDEQVGRSPEHHSGRIYMQDPGAMAPLSAIEIPKGAKVVDLCAAPGGKSSQAAAMIGEKGFILSNEFVPKRAKILVGNLERLGVKNAVVTSLDTSKLCEFFTEFFDYAIVDAPCSGEGMFRKNDLAVEEWSEENVKICAERQDEILENASRLIGEGGYIIYSTCTYSPEENEGTIDRFLSSHENFSIVELPKKIIDATADPICDGYDKENVKFARRFYPHISKGEGQFLALIRKNSSNMSTKVGKDASKPLSKQENEAVLNFFKEAFSTLPLARLAKVGESVVLLPESTPAVPPYSVFMAGVLVGEIQKGRLIPSHQLFSAYGEFFKSKVELSENEKALSLYLEGEEIDAPEGAKNGYCVITYKGSALGGGKIANGRIKNHYPKGLRNRKL